jgi:hypothetical protein
MKMEKKLGIKKLLIEFKSSIFNAVVFMYQYTP